MPGSGIPQQEALQNLLRQCLSDSLPDLQGLATHLDEILKQGAAPPTRHVRVIPPAPGTCQAIPLPFGVTQDNLAAMSVLYRAEDGKTYGESSGVFSWDIQGIWLNFTVNGSAPKGLNGAHLDLWFQLLQQP